MNSRLRQTLLGITASLLVATASPPAGASTFVRAGVADLVAANDAVVVGEVLGTRSYWNQAGTFILTDVRVAVSDVLKGAVGAREITVTLPGGKVGDLAAIIVGGANLVPGGWYVLFLDRVDLLGARGVLTVHHHGQGAFDVEIAADGLRAFSQARQLDLLPDAVGDADPPGGARGIPFTALVQTVRELAARERDGRPEVQR